MAMTRLTDIPSVGKAAEKDLKALGASNARDILDIAPRAYEDRRSERRLSDATVDNPVIYCKIEVEKKSYFPSKAGRTLRVECSDENGDRLSLLCFSRDYLDKTLVIGSMWYITAKVQKYKGVYSSASFEIKKDPKELLFGTIIPIYPLCGNLKQNQMRHIVKAVLDSYSPIADRLPEDIYERNGLMHHDQAYHLLHFPSELEDVKKARRTLAFTELFRLELEISREKEPDTKSRPVITAKEKALIESLPFSLTSDQLKVLQEIRKDLDSAKPMTRLLQGDVGSGKTLVAWISALHEITKGGQVAFMAPTELLARQHADGAAQLLEKLGIRICFLTGEVKNKSRALLEKALESGDIDLAIGTHALFSGKIKFKNLKYVIIDEQHRFGVGQREALKQKGKDPHILMMSATPIPRTLALTYYADQEISTIKTMPAGRIPIKTYLVSEKKREEMFRAIDVEFKRGHQAYFVYPRIEEDGESDLRPVKMMFEELKTIYPLISSAMIHSRLEEEEKNRILADFKNGKISYLVSTSVVEVGIDVPNATCMVIEHSERFGLAALHQLRGRVGRSDIPSYCFLVFSDSLTEEGKERLSVMKQTNDGFLIAEKDMAIRGPGDITGNKQSGFMKLKHASLVTDQDLILLAKNEADRIAKEDRGLLKAENAVLRNKEG